MNGFESVLNELDLIKAQLENYLRLRDIPTEVEYEIPSETEDDRE